MLLIENKCSVIEGLQEGNNRGDFIFIQYFFYDLSSAIMGYIVTFNTNPQAVETAIMAIGIGKSQIAQRGGHKCVPIGVQLGHIEATQILVIEGVPDTVEIFILKQWRGMATDALHVENIFSATLLFIEIDLTKLISIVQSVHADQGIFKGRNTGKKCPFVNGAITPSRIGSRTIKGVLIHGGDSGVDISTHFP